MMDLFPPSIPATPVCTSNQSNMRINRLSSLILGLTALVFATDSSLHAAGGSYLNIPIIVPTPGTPTATPTSTPTPTPTPTTWTAWQMGPYDGWRPVPGTFNANLSFVVDNLAGTIWPVPRQMMTGEYTAAGLDVFFPGHINSGDSAAEMYYDHGEAHTGNFVTISQAVVTTTSYQTVPGTILNGGRDQQIQRTDTSTNYAVHAITGKFIAEASLAPSPTVGLSAGSRGMRSPTEGNMFGTVGVDWSAYLGGLGIASPDLADYKWIWEIQYVNGIPAAIEQQLYRRIVSPPGGGCVVDPVYRPAYSSYYQSLGAPASTPSGYWVAPSITVNCGSGSSIVMYQAGSVGFPYSGALKSINGHITNFGASMAGFDLPDDEAQLWDTGVINRTLHWEGAWNSATGRLEECRVGDDGIVYTQDVTYNAYGQATSFVFGAKVPTSRLTPTPQPPTATITADSVIMTVGDTTTIRANYLGSISDPMQQTNIESPEGTGLPGLNPNSPTAKNYSYTPTSVGTKSFFARIATATYPVATYGQIDVTTVKASPNATLSLSTTSAVIGQSVTLTAPLTGGYTPTGGVSFSVNTVDSATSATPIVGGSYSAIAAGTYYLFASYAGDANNNSFTTSGVPLTVSKASPTITLSLSTSVTTVGQAVSLSSQISGGNNPTGVASYSVNTTNSPLTATPIIGSSYAAPAAGSYFIFANYPGDTNNNSAFAFATLSTFIDYPVAISVTGANSTIGNSVTLTGHANDIQGAVLTELNFSVKGPGLTTWISLDPVAVSGTDATGLTTFSPTSVGSWTVRLNAKNSSGNFCDPSKPEVTSTFAVTKALPALAFSISNASIYEGQSVNLTSQLTGGFNPTATVTYSVNTTNSSITATPILGTAYTPPSAGTYYLFANYAGDMNNSAVTTTAPLSVVAKGNQTKPIITALSTRINVGGSISVLPSGGTGSGNYVVNVLGASVAVPDQVTVETAGSAPVVTSAFTYPCTVQVQCYRKGDVSHVDSPMSDIVSVDVTPAVLALRVDPITAAHEFTVTPNTTSIHLGEAVTYTIHGKNVNVSMIAGGAAAINVGSFVGTASSVTTTVTPTKGGLMTNTFNPTVTGDDTQSITITQAGGTSLRVVDPDGVSTVYPMQDYVVATKTGAYYVSSIWSNGTVSVESDAVRVDVAAPTVQTVLNPINDSISVLPRLNGFTIQRPTQTAVLPTITVSPSVPLGPFDELTVPCDLTIAWTNATGSVTGPSLNRTAPADGSATVSVTPAMLSGNGTLTYTATTASDESYAAWSGAGCDSVSVLYSVDNTSFAPLTSFNYTRGGAYDGIISGDTKPTALNAGWYKVELQNPAGITTSSPVQAVITISSASASAQPKIPLVVTGSNSLGSVTGGANYAYGQTAADIVATAVPGAQFTYFSGDTSGHTTMTTAAGQQVGRVAGLTMTAPRAIAAHFDSRSYAVTTSISAPAGVSAPNSALTVTGTGYTDYFNRVGYKAGSTVTVAFNSPLSALGNPIYSLSGWLDNGVMSGSANPYVINLSGDHTLVAVVTARVYTLTTSGYPSDGTGTAKIYSKDGSFVNVATVAPIAANPTPGPYPVDSVVALSTFLPTVSSSDNRCAVQAVVWNGPYVVPGSLNQASVTIKQDTSVTAQFLLKGTQTVSAVFSPVAGSTVTVGTPITVVSARSNNADLVPEIDSPDNSVSYNPSTGKLTPLVSGTITVRVWQAGDSKRLPAQPVLYHFSANPSVQLTVGTGAGAPTATSNTDAASQPASQSVITVPK